MNPPAAPHSFQTTRWSLVRRAVGADDAAGRAALAALCQGYWYPLYAFIRRSGKSPHDAEDLTQGFFARLLEKDMLAAADPAKGKLRTFLLACLRHYLADEHDRAQARKRFQRRWALTLVEETLRLLGEEFAAQGKGPLFTALRPFLGFGTGAVKSYEELAPELAIPVGTLKNHVFRLRERWREMLFEQVAATLDEPTPEEIKAELSELLACV